MNILMLMSGGVGKRFGADVPKQFVKVLDKPLINYALDAVYNAKKIDRVIVVIDKQYLSLCEKLEEYDCDFVTNGTERMDSVKNGLDYIKKHYSCTKLIITDAVTPFVYPELFDNYFELLDEYDAVITAQKITASLVNYDFDPIDREKYFIAQSPEGFRFELLYNNFRCEYNAQELATQLPKNSRIYLNFNFKQNLKITYDFELFYVEHVLKHNALGNNSILFLSDSGMFNTEGMGKYLLRAHPKQTEEWLRRFSVRLPELMEKWKINHITANQTSKFGLVLLAESQIYGDVVIKAVPDFIERYKQELNSYRTLSGIYMCKLLDTYDKLNILLLEKIKPANYASFEDNIQLTRFFNNVAENMVSYDETIHIGMFNSFEKQLREKRDNASKLPFFSESFIEIFERTCALYDDYFSGMPLYVLHGDLHGFNILKRDSDYYAIDPIGFVAPHAFEFTRFIFFDLTMNKQFDTKRRFEMLIDYFSQWESADMLRYAVYIDSVNIAFNSVLECGASETTHSYLEIINTVQKNLT